MKEAIEELIEGYSIVAKNHLLKQYEYEKEGKLGLAGKHRGKKEAYRTVIHDLTNLLNRTNEDLSTK